MSVKWQKVKLGDVCQAINTGPFGSQLHQHDYSASGTPVVMPKDIVDGKVSEDGIARVSDGHIKRLSRHQVVAGDLLFSRRGDVGRCALIGQRENGWLCGTGCLRVQLDVEKVFPPFVFRSMCLSESVKWLEGHAVGSTMPNINASILSDVPVSFPPLPVQKKIASILSAYDDLIENNRRRIAILEEMARKVYRKRFGGKNANGTIVDVGAVCDTIGGGTPSTSISDYWEGGTIPWVVPTDVTRNTSVILLDTDRKITQKGLESSSSRMLPARSILMTSRASVGYFAIANFPVCTNQGFISIVPHEEKMRYYLLHNLMERVEEIRSNAKGSTFPEISKMRFRSLKINVPSQGALNNFHLIVEPIYNQVQTLAVANRKLATARDALLPKLMSGKLEAAV